MRPRGALHAALAALLLGLPGVAAAQDTLRGELEGHWLNEDEGASGVHYDMENGLVIEYRLEAGRLRTWVSDVSLPDDDRWEITLKSVSPRASNVFKGASSSCTRVRITAKVLEGLCTATLRQGQTRSFSVRYRRIAEREFNERFGLEWETTEKSPPGGEPADPDAAATP